MHREDVSVSVSVVHCTNTYFQGTPLKANCRLMLSVVSVMLRRISPLWKEDGENNQAAYRSVTSDKDLPVPTEPSPPKRKTLISWVKGGWKSYPQQQGSKQILGTLKTPLLKSTVNTGKRYNIAFLIRPYKYDFILDTGRGGGRGSSFLPAISAELGPSTYLRCTLSHKIFMVEIISHRTPVEGT